MFRPGEYPANLVEFNDWFNSDQACREYLEIIRWPDGFQCPKCGTRRHWVLGKRGVKECAGCHHQSSVIAGTIFDGTRKPLRLWFLAEDALLREVSEETGARLEFVEVFGYAEIRLLGPKPAGYRYPYPESLHSPALWARRLLRPV